MIICLLSSVFYFHFSAISGGGSAGRRKILVLHLIRSCREMEMKFLVRTLVRNLRIGAMMKTILPALAHAVVLHGKCATGPVVSLEGVKSQLQVCLTKSSLFFCSANDFV